MEITEYFLKVVKTEHDAGICHLTVTLSLVHPMTIKIIILAVAKMSAICY